jgi:hypothetical protein
MPTIEPMIKLDPGGEAPVVSYNVPEPTSYSGRNFIELDFGDDYFKDEFAKPPPEKERPPVKNLDATTLKSAVENAMKSGFTDAKLFPNVRLLSTPIRLVEKPNPGLTIHATEAVSTKLLELSPTEVTAAMQAGKRLNIYKSLFGTLTYNYVPEPVDPRPRLYIVETYRLSSFLGTYGAGRVIKTFSLLPGEKTRISVKTYTRKETDAKRASSILDSFTEESADDFESSVQNEQSNKKGYAKTFEYHAEAEASASWGFGSAKVSGGVKGSTNSSREEFAKNISSATQKHAAKASAKRDVQINTSYEVKEQTGEETAIEREIQNINLSRTLNFVFRQMNQQFITILHLVDVRIGFFNGYAESKREVPLPKLSELLDEVIVHTPAKRKEVEEAIISQLKNVWDYKDVKHSLIEERDLGQGDTYWRVKKPLVSKFKHPITKFEVEVEGIILSARDAVVRTEGVIVEALLGQGMALDGYATELQGLEVARREAEVKKISAEAARASLVNKLASDKDTARAKVLSDLTCPCAADGAALNVNMRTTAV